MTAHERPARTRSGGGLPRGDGDEGVGEVAAVQFAYGRLCVQDHHPDVGDVTLGYQSMRLEGTLDHRLVVYHAEPATPSTTPRSRSTRPRTSTPRPAPTCKGPRSMTTPASPSS